VIGIAWIMSMCYWFVSCATDPHYSERYYYLFCLLFDGMSVKLLPTAEY